MSVRNALERMAFREGQIVIGLFSRSYKKPSSIGTRLPSTENDEMEIQNDDVTQETVTSIEKDIH